MRRAGKTVIGFAAVLAILLSGCSLANAPILDPQGPVALEERNTLIRAFLMMMIVVIPVFVLAGWFTLRYRASRNARYDPNWQSSAVDAGVWIVASLIVLILGIHSWIYTHRLDPYKPLDPNVAPFEVQAIAQDWKWLFLYPDLGVASVNEMAIPAGVPVRIRITSDTVMNAFFVPALGSQIYAMAGMQTQLNLKADSPGVFVGRNTQYSGAGFADQHFAVRALDEAGMQAWLTTVRESPRQLDDAAYAELAEPSQANPVAYYAAFEPDLFAGIIGKYDHAMASHGSTGAVDSHADMAHE